MTQLHTHRNNHHHALQYFILFLLLSISFFAFQQSSNSKEKQLLIAAVSAITYVLWGIFHHVYDKDLKPKIVLEYSTIGLFGLGIIWALLII